MQVTKMEPDEVSALVKKVIAGMDDAKARSLGFTDRAQYLEKMTEYANAFLGRQKTAGFKIEPILKAAHQFFMSEGKDTALAAKNPFGTKKGADIAAQIFNKVFQDFGNATVEKVGSRGYAVQRVYTKTVEPEFVFNEAEAKKAIASFMGDNLKYIDGQSERSVLDKMKSEKVATEDMAVWLETNNDEYFQVKEQDLSAGVEYSELKNPALSLAISEAIDPIEREVKAQLEQEAEKNRETYRKWYHWIPIVGEIANILTSEPDEVKSSFIYSIPIVGWFANIFSPRKYPAEEPPPSVIQERVYERLQTPIELEHDGKRFQIYSEDERLMVKQV
ncbi:hypothetical protein KJ780_03445 [Candidatus Micrarchaeota archaeon]|nr:hypothetical protein [Candidatus Micrarchaeota archaeon]